MPHSLLALGLKEEGRWLPSAWSAGLVVTFLQISPSLILFDLKKGHDVLSIMLGLLVLFFFEKSQAVVPDPAEFLATQL